MATQPEPTRQPAAQVVVQLNPGKPAGEMLTPDESAALADRVLKRVASEVGHPAARVNVLRNVAAMVVEADPAFLESLARQPEVTSARPNEASESLVIPPVRKRKI